MSPSRANRPSSGNEFLCRGPPEAGDGRLRRWWAETARVKLEREQGDRSLRREVGANRRGRRRLEAARVRSRGGTGANADGPRGCGEYSAKRK